MLKVLNKCTVIRGVFIDPRWSHSMWLRDRMTVTKIAEKGVNFKERPRTEYSSKYRKKGCAGVLEIDKIGVRKRDWENLGRKGRAHHWEKIPSLQSLSKMADVQVSFSQEFIWTIFKWITHSKKYFPYICVWLLFIHLLFLQRFLTVGFLISHCLKNNVYRPHAVMTVSVQSLFSAAVAGRPAVNSREQLRRPPELQFLNRGSGQQISDMRYRFCMYWNRTKLSELNITCVWTCNSRTQLLDTFMF